MSSRVHLHQCRTGAVIRECVGSGIDCTSYMIGCVKLPLPISFVECWGNFQTLPCVFCVMYSKHFICREYC